MCLWSYLRLFWQTVVVCVSKKPPTTSAALRGSSKSQSVRGRFPHIESDGITSSFVKTWTPSLNVCALVVRRDWYRYEQLVCRRKFARTHLPPPAHPVHRATHSRRPTCRCASTSDARRRRCQLP